MDKKPEIPGYYYDAEKKKYFKIQPQAFNDAECSYGARNLSLGAEKRQIACRKSRIRNQKKRKQSHLLKQVLNREIGICGLKNVLSKWSFINAKQHVGYPNTSRPRIQAIECTLLTSDGVLCILDHLHNISFNGLDLTKPYGKYLWSHNYAVDYQMLDESIESRFRLKGNIVELSPGQILSCPTETKLRNGLVHLFTKTESGGERPYNHKTHAIGKNFFAMIKCPHSSSQIFTCARHSIARYDLETTTRLKHVLEIPLRTPCLAADEANVVYASSSQQNTILSIDYRDRNHTILHRESTVHNKRRLVDDDFNFITSLKALDNGYSLCTGFFESKVALFDIRMRKYISDDRLSSYLKFAANQLETDETTSYIARVSVSRDIYIWETRELNSVGIVCGDKQSWHHIDVTTKYGLPMILATSHTHTNMIKLKPCI